MPRKTQTRIANALEQISDDSRSSNAVKLMGEVDLWRLRVGDYRIIYEIQDKEVIVLVLRIGHRKGVYR
ncbi:MAG: type II toxin-antitoxin system RelE/ParE family toxin [Gemmataceae bacterium]|nr:type II toxin-antitoxin system RelE/ParE family toxin [Gemmataceae bacterium]MCI0740674.1 type II toxin-antitoxin system RelE/ParE family toxin [Gemmataceae bacterium]